MSPQRNSDRPRKGALLLVWLAAALPLGAALAVATFDRRPLDDPDLVFQRPGFLDAHSEPFPAPRVNEELPSPGTRLVLFFVRPEQMDAVGRALKTDRSLSESARIAIAVAGRQPPAEESPIVWLADSSGSLARGFHMPRPRDGGPPVGYAIVDSSGLVRYRTLDPTMAERLKEAETMLRATP